MKNRNAKIASLATGGLSYGISYLMSRNNTSSPTKLYQDYKDGHISAVDIIEQQKRSIKLVRKIVGGSFILIAAIHPACNRTAMNYNQCIDSRLANQVIFLSGGTFIFFKTTPFEQFLDKIIQNENKHNVSFTLEPSAHNTNLVFRYYM